MGKGIFVTGTDTGVGKTLVTAGIAAVLKKRGIDVGVMKPVESGCVRQDGHLLTHDAAFLKEMSGSQDEMEAVNIYALESPLAPAIAAEIEGVEIRPQAIKDAYQRLASRHSLVLVEGAGGLLVPLTGDYLVADLVRDLGLPILLVATAHLGTINHTLLTLRYAEREGIPALGMVVNHTSRENGLAASLNPSALRRWARAPVIGVMPFLSSPDRGTIESAVEANLDLGLIERWLRGKPG